MESLSRESSRQILLDDTNSLTSFPAPSTNTPSQDNESAVQPLHALLDGNGPSMFDDNTAVNSDDPQSLSAAPAHVLQEVIDNAGAVEIVRRLSTMLAERDAHITALTRLAEEYRIPKERIIDTASRVKQSERRRLSLATASEDLAPSSTTGTESSVRLLHARNDLVNHS